MKYWLLLLLLSSWNIEPGDKIAIFNGSFDPPHLEHLKTIEKTLDAGFSHIFIHPAYGNGRTKIRTAHSARIQMLKTFENDQVHVISRLTKDWIETLQQKGACLFAIYGSDQIYSDYNTLKENSFDLQGYIFKPRPEYPLTDEMIKSFAPLPIVVLKAQTNPLSSTLIRERISARKDISDYVLPSTLHLIKLAKLYETISNAKQNGDYPVDVVEEFILRESIPHMIKKLTSATEVKKIKERKGIEVYQTEKNIIKVYPHKHYYEFIDEIWAIETLRRCEPKHFVVPSIEAVYTLFDVTENYHLIIQKIFPGNSLVNSTNERAFHQYGVALAELHQLKPLHRLKTPKKLINSLNDDVFLPWSLKQKISYAKSYGYVQHDTHEGNVLFDEQKDLICLIDLSTIGFFLDNKLNPIAPVALDYVHFVNRIKEKPLLQNAFKEGYKMGGGELFSQKVLNHYLHLTNYIHDHKKETE